MPACHIKETFVLTNGKTPNMKYSYNAIQNHIVEKLPSVTELEQKIIFHAFEVEEVQQLGDDTVMDIKVLPDRAGDCMSHYGMAREIAGLLKLTLKQSTKEVVVVDELYPVRIVTGLCNRYMAIKIDGVNVGASPEWLRVYLESIGQKSINNIVDATNFILNDLGQPTHVFDADKIVGGITVRMAIEAETVTTLSHEEKVLKETDIVIADDEGVLAIAGVKGGKKAEVTPKTKNIILEIANFDAVAVRKTSRRLNLITDASKRFENTFSSVSVLEAAVQLAKLVTEIAGGTIVAVTDQYPTKQIERTIEFSVQDIARTLGDWVTEESISKVFDQYHYSYIWNNELCTLSVPYWRQDITGAHDICEEVGRVSGYENIPTKDLPFTPAREENEVDVKIQSIKKYLVSQGFSEVMNYTFRKKGDLYVSHAPKDKSALRTNLSDGIKESFDMNKLNAAILGVHEVKLFEIGTVFCVNEENIHVATATKVGSEEMTLDEFIAKYSVVTTGSHIHLPPAVQLFRQWSSYPFIVRDVAVWIPQGESITFGALDTVMKEFAQIHTVVPATMFDTFSKEGRTSYAYRFIFQANDRTLTDSEVAELIAPLLKNILEIPHTELR